MNGVNAARDAAQTRGAPLLDTRDAREKVRFTVELEFVQCLANPYYLNRAPLPARSSRPTNKHVADLAQNLYFEDERFVAYLRYLRDYWRKPEYARFLTAPSCLDVLELVLCPRADAARLKDPAVCERIHQQQFYAWMHGVDVERPDPT